ncbi:MAG: carbohydrate porin, partial [Acidithiobacillus ferrooxidans]
MPCLFRLATAVLILCAGTFGPFSGVWAAEDPAAWRNGPVPDATGLSPKYLPAYRHLTDGISWAGHADSELFSNLTGGIRRGSEGNLAGQIGGEYDTEKAGLWKGGKFSLSLMGIY